MPETETYGPRHRKQDYQVLGERNAKDAVSYTHSIADPVQRRDAMMDEMWQGLTRTMAHEGVLLMHHTLRETSYDGGALTSFEMMDDKEPDPEADWRRDEPAIPEKRIEDVLPPELVRAIRHHE